MDKKIYMDHSATTPVDPEVFAAMMPFYQYRFGNPSSIHSIGRDARIGLVEAREKTAALINAVPEEIIFCSGGTEANNLAITSYMETNRNQGNHIITSAIEHDAVLDTCHYLESRGFDLTVLPVDPYGQVEPNQLRAAIRPNTALVSIMHANNEIGTIQPLKKLVEITHEAGVVFHTDAVQTTGKIPVDIKHLGVDMLSASSHKFYGPKGIGFLYVKKGITLERLIHGGGQESKRRAGTENVPGIVGMAKAAEIATNNMQETQKKTTYLGHYLMKGIIDTIPDTRITGHPEHRLPGSVSVCFDYVEGESIVLMLDHKGVMSSSGSACTSGTLEPSHVLRAIGLKSETAHGSLRLTLGKNNTLEEVQYVLQALPPIITSLRNMSPLYSEA